MRSSHVKSHVEGLCVLVALQVKVPLHFCDTVPDHDEESITFYHRL